jgi:hypothetical protein
MEFLPFILQAGGMIISASGQLQAGKAEQEAANFNAAVARNNAAAARAAALEDSRREKRLGTKRQGARRAIDPDNLDLLEDNAMEDELLVLTTLHAGEVEAIGFESTGALETARGKAARASGRMSAAGTLLGGAGKLAGSLGGGNKPKNAWQEQSSLSFARGGA